MAAGSGEPGSAGPEAGGGRGIGPRGLSSVCGALLPSARRRGAWRGRVSRRIGGDLCPSRGSEAPCGCEIPQAAPGLLRGARARKGAGHRAGASAASAEGGRWCPKLRVCWLREETLPSLIVAAFLRCRGRCWQRSGLQAQNGSILADKRVKKRRTEKDSLWKLCETWEGDTAGNP